MKNKGFVSDTLTFCIFIVQARLINLLVITVVALIARAARISDIEYILCAVFGALASAAAFFVLFNRNGRKAGTDGQTAEALLLPLIVSQLIYFAVCLIFKYSAIFSGPITYIAQIFEGNADSSEIYPSVYKEYLSSFLIATAILSALEIAAAMGGYALGVKKGKKERAKLHQYSEKVAHL